MISNVQFNAPQLQARPAFKARPIIAPPKIVEKKAATKEPFSLVKFFKELITGEKKEPGYINLGRLQVSEQLVAEACRKNNIEAEAQKHLLPKNWA